LKISVGALGALLTKNAVEIKFRRRRKKQGWSPIRRMLATNDLKLLNSPPGHITLNYKMPTHPPAFNVAAKNLVLAWDILYQDWRLISCEDCNVISVIPTDPPAKWWEYFTKNIQYMTPAQKEAFCNAVR